MNLASNLIAMLVPANLFWEDGFLLGKIVLKKKKKKNNNNKKRTSKLKHIEIGGSKVNFFASCLRYLHVSSNRNSSYIYRNQEAVSRSKIYELELPTICYQQMINIFPVVTTKSISLPLFRGVSENKSMLSQM